MSIVIVPAREFLVRVGGFIPNLLGVLIILVVGWIIAKLVREIVTRGLKLIKLDDISKKAKISSILIKGDIKYSLSELIGIAFYWFIILIVLMAAINALGLTVTASLLNRVIAYVPNVIAAMFVLALGLFLANFLASIVYTAANNAGLPQSKMISQIVQVVITVFVVVVMLEQLRVAVRLITFTLEIIVAAIGLGCALAFGLGCKDIANKSMQDFLGSFKKK